MSSKFINTLAKAITIAIIGVGLIFIASIFLNTQGKETSETEKNEEQIKYLDSKFVSLINALNNIQLQNYRITLTKIEAKSNATSGSSSKNEKQGNEEEDKGQSGSNKEETKISKLEEESIVINDEQKEPDWNTIESELELLYSTWPTIVLDLQNIGVNKEDILGFTNTLDDVILNVKNKEKALSAMYFAKLYGFLPKFLDKNFGDEIKREALNAKTNLINAYAYAETDNFDKMQAEITNAEMIFGNLVNDAKYVNDDRKYNINKAYVLIGELKNSLITNDKGIFYVKYKNTLEELNILS